MLYSIDESKDTRRTKIPSPFDRQQERETQERKRETGGRKWRDNYLKYVWMNHLLHVPLVSPVGEQYLTSFRQKSSLLICHSQQTLMGSRHFLSTGLERKLPIHYRLSPVMSVSLSFSHLTQIISLNPNQEIMNGW